MNAPVAAAVSSRARYVGTRSDPAARDPECGPCRVKGPPRDHGEDDVGAWTRSRSRRRSPAIMRTSRRADASRRQCIGPDKRCPLAPAPRSPGGRNAVFRAGANLTPGSPRFTGRCPRCGVSSLACSRPLPFPLHMNVPVSYSVSGASSCPSVPPRHPFSRDPKFSAWRRQRWPLRWREDPPRGPLSLAADLQTRAGTC
jgi:hypothetical protein